MNMRNSEISRDFGDWLDRRSCPTDLRDKPAAAMKESEALLACLLKFAPRSDYKPFTNRVLEQLDYQMKSRFWPTINEFASVCSNIRKETGKTYVDETGGAKDMRAEAITARAMKEGKPVGEGWLYGRDAVTMIAARLIDEETMRKYRSGAFLARRKLYGEASALAWEVEAKSRHEDAKRIHREEPSSHDVSMPDKRVLSGFAV